MCDEETSAGGEEDQGGGAVLIRIHVPDLNIHKCLQFYRHDLVWDVKQQCLASLPKELKESFNYGLFAPPCNGKAGKFLDEERPLTDYPFSGPVGYLELRYKRRLYKGINVEEKHLKSLHTKSNLRRFLDYVSSGHCEKITKMCSKGLDPNFHCPETGETPLSMAALMKKPSKLLMALVNGGALLDYRTKDGATAMHRAVEAKSLEAVKTMLDLGGSPNYRDTKGLTPLYLSVATNADPTLCEALLHDHAFIGAQDMQGWHETHQACRNGLVQHLEHLLYYGADMNARNASGNTPLHVCAVNNQESSARLLLFRGADKEALNFANQTPYQVAVIAGNMELAEIIQTHRSQDVVPFRDLPKYNPKRRSVISRALSDPRLNCSMTCLSGRLSRGPPSPCPSNRSLPPFSSASSCLSECSGHTRSGSCSDSSYSGGSSHFGSEDNCGSAITDKSLDHSDITSDSSGVGTCNSGGSGSSYDAMPPDPALILPGMMVVCIENYSAASPRHLQLAEGDIIEVTASTDTGLLEGSLRGQMGLFPSSCVQEIRMKSYENRNHLAPPSSRAQGRREMTAKQYANIPRIKKIYAWGEPHTVILHRGQKGFGFVLRGAKSDSPLMELQPSDRFPALQYLDDVDENGVADRAGLKKGDFILSINAADVSQSSHETVVDLIRKSGELVSMTVVGLSLPSNTPQENSKPGSPASLTCDQGSGGTPKAQYHFATLPRKYSGSSGPSVPSPPRRDPNTSLSVGRARAKSMVAALADLGVGNPGQTSSDGSSSVGTKSNSVDSIAGKPPLPPGATNNNNGTPVCSNGTLQPKTASIRARPTSSRITASEMQEIFVLNSQNGDDGGKASWTYPPSPLLSGSHKIYASVSEMKRSKSGLKGKELVKLHKEFHSTPDLKGFMNQKKNSTTASKSGSPKESKSKSLSQENLNKLRVNPRHSWACISSTVQELFDRNYENSWKSIEKISPPPPEKSVEKSAEKEDGNESDGSTASGSSSSSSGKETPKSVKTPVLTEGEYRTIKPLRPIQSKTLPRRASTGCTIGPAEQQTIINLVPPGQVIKVDVSKSKEYASLDIATSGGGRQREGGPVMSSFKPTDSAKLYASPDDLKSIGYREPGSENNTGTLKKPRSHSLPPGKKDSDGKGDYAQPETLRVAKDSNGVAKEGAYELLNGNGKSDDSDALTPTNASIKSSDSSSSSTTPHYIPESDYETGGKLRQNSNTNGDGKFDPQKSLQEAKDKLKPVKPVLKTSSSLSGSHESTKIRIEVKQSPRLARKGEKTVTFQSEAPQQQQQQTQNQQPQQQKQAQGAMSHSMSVDEIQKVKTSLKISKSFPNDLGQDGDGDGNSSSGVSSSDLGSYPEDTDPNANNYVTCLPVNPDSDSSEDSSDKTWILKDENGPSSSTASNTTTSDTPPTVIPSQPPPPLQTVSNNSNNNNPGVTAESKRCTSDKVLPSPGSVLINHSNAAIVTPMAHVQLGKSGGILSNSMYSQQQQILQQQQQLQQQHQHAMMFGKTPGMVSTHHHVQQQQQQQQQQMESSMSNYGTLSRSSNLRAAGGGGGVNGGNLTKNAVSLVKLPPPMEIESETDESKSPRETPIQKKQPSIMGSGTGVLMSSSQIYHTLQPQRSRSMLVDHQQQQLHHQQQQQLAARQLQQLQGQVQGQTRQAEKSIEESLKLIQMHVAALKQDFPSVVPPPPEFGLRNQTPILAPPPEFSDARDTHESATRFNQSHSNQMFQGDAHGMPPGMHGAQQPFNRQSPMYRSISHAHSSSSSMYSGYPTMTRQQYQQQMHQQQMQIQQQQQQQQQQHSQQSHSQIQQVHPQQLQTSHSQQMQQTHPGQPQPSQSQSQSQQHLQQQLHSQQQSHQPQAQHLHSHSHQQQATQQQHHSLSQQQQQQQQQHLMSMSMPTYQTLGRHTSYGSTNPPPMMNTSSYGHYQTLANPKMLAQSHQPPSSQQSQPSSAGQSTGQPQLSQSGSASSAMFQAQHHPKCYYYQQSASAANTSAGKYIPEKLHPVHRYTPDLYESSSGPRIVGTIPKKQPGADHYEVPHAHQQMLAQQQQQKQQQQQQQHQQQLHQQQQQQQAAQQGTRIRREFRNKMLPDWSVSDACDWLDSLFMPEYKVIFQQRSIDGKKLLRMDNATLLELGVKKLGHRMNIEKSLKRYLPQPKT